MRPEVTQLFPEGPQPAVLLFFRLAEYRHLRSEWPSPDSRQHERLCAGDAAQGIGNNRSHAIFIQAIAASRPRAPSCPTRSSL